MATQTQTASASSGTWTQIGSSSIHEAVELMGDGKAVSDFGSPDSFTLTDFGFTIPGTATVDSITVTIRATSTIPWGLDVDVTKNGTTVVSGGDGTVSVSPVPYTFYSNTVTPTLTPAEVNASTFGVILTSVIADAGNCNVDMVTIEVEYTPVGSVGGTGLIDDPASVVFLECAGTIEGVAQGGNPPEDYRQSSFQVGEPIDAADRDGGGVCGWSGHYAPASRLVYVEGYGRVIDTYAPYLKGRR